ncbi:DUF362 domain-containing protein [Pseudodesulfovibrio sediminis]|uniref:DUF362 domain-containing protein n=1 Tax=Pseudodesulfovibrio sediminis TaxID=2810563 RepID=A0ABM7P4S8_9BACT|nr:DUF362 domain-containing protein [Pseudodesulfovibrio sediminis]BCS87905.1 hypothetical protein PSDVSF_11470 [Pseudodesulfovibrio sediminis]
MSTRVAIAHILEYESTLLQRATQLILEESGLTIHPGQTVLVKPNLVNGSNARHCTTHPRVVQAACTWLLDQGARVTVADSPAFGPASYVARASGLADALGEIGLKAQSLKRATPLTLSQGGTIGLSQDALEADLILNIPKLKVHCQMTMSGAVKNMFGCVVGFRKALAHNRLGHSHEVFRSMLMDVYAALPHTHHLVDGIHPLHKDGPIKGVPFELGWLAASSNGIAIDTAAYALLGLRPQQVPLWDEAMQRNLIGADPRDLLYPLEKPDQFDTTGFVLSPERELAFTPSRLMTGRIRSLLKHFKK